MDKNLQVALKIIGYANKILSYCDGVEQEGFRVNSLLIDACVMNLIQIGELAKHFSEDFVQKNSNIPLRQIRGLRNRIVHDYEGLNLLHIKTIICEDLPALIKKLEGLL